MRSIRKKMSVMTSQRRHPEPSGITDRREGSWFVQEEPIEWTDPLYDEVKQKDISKGCATSLATKSEAM